MPIINKLPEENEDKIVQSIMTTKVVTIQNVESIENIVKILTSNNHHAFPVINSHGRVVGLMPRNYLISLVEVKAFYLHGKSHQAHIEEAPNAAD